MRNILSERGGKRNAELVPSSRHLDHNLGNSVETYDSSLNDPPSVPNPYIRMIQLSNMTHSLDDTVAISRVDRGDMLGAVARFPDYLSETGRFLGIVRAGRERSYDNIALAGMGGSASAGDFLQDWLGERILTELAIFRQPKLPRSVGKGTLLIAFSYSGNTWETLEAFHMARRRGSSLVAVSSGGKLEKLCEKWDVPLLRLDTGLAPRAALTQMIRAGTVALQESGATSGSIEELARTGDELRQLRKRIGTDVSSSKNKAKLFASKLLGKVPAVYSLYRMASVARRFKNQLAENSKVLAILGLLPEACHNELEASGKTANSTRLVLIRDTVENREEQALLDTFRRVTREQGAHGSLEVKIRGQSELGRLLAPALFLDYASVYLAILRGTDPSPTPWIASYKARYASVIASDRGSPTNQRP